MFARDISRTSRPSLNRILNTANITANINPREHVFVSKTQILITANINEFTVPSKIVVLLNSVVL